MARKKETKENRKEAAPTRKVERERERKDDAGRKKSTSKRGTAPRKSGRSANPVIRYFQETSDELRKVTWPTRKQALRLTIIVLATMLAFMIFLGLFDLLFQQLAGLLV